MPVAYPSVALSRNSRIEIKDRRFLNVAASGKFGAGDYVTTAPYELRLRHELISSADSATLESFYAANLQTADVQVVFIDGKTYEGQVTAFNTYMDVAGLYYAEMTLTGYAQ